MNVDEAIEEFDFFNEGDYITRKMAEAKDVVLKELKELQEVKSDLYEANNRINDLLDIVKQKDKRIADLEYSLLDMILQFADEDKNSISTMGLSALETAFVELNLDDPMPIKEVHKLYKELAKKYFEERCK